MNSAGQARRGWMASGEPWIWLNAAAVGVSISAVLGLLMLIGAQGLAHFWPAAVQEVNVAGRDAPLLGEWVDHETVPLHQFLEANPGVQGEGLGEFVERRLLKTGNRREAPPDFRWINAHDIVTQASPIDALVIERTEWGNVYGQLQWVRFDGETTTNEAFTVLKRGLERATTLRDEIAAIESGIIKTINSELERLRLERRRAALRGGASGASSSGLDAREAELTVRYAAAESRLRDRQQALRRDVFSVRLADGTTTEINFGDALRAWQPNTMGIGAKLAHYGQSLWIFLSDPPREANTEGGIFPAIFGTVMMVLLMSVLVTPFGVIAAVYLREYARQGAFVRLIRIAVNNLAGVPSIVYGVFGLGFFVYFVGGAIDELLFPEALPAPTFGTPGLLWASLTLALLTVPVVIVSTEEGLARIPRAIREGSLALGATKAETLFRVMLPMASPSILTGVILAIARAAGEVAPLMLVGVVKLAPTLPLDGDFPFLHLDRKFMHLGFHIYDVGFQSPNVEAARPLVYATALLLVLIIIVLNLTAIMLRNRLEARYKSLEG